MVEAVKVTVLLVPVDEAGLKLAVTPVGKPLALNATALENPPARGIVITLDALAPRTTSTLVGFGESAKSGCGGVALDKSCVCGMICFSMPSGVLHARVAEASPPFS